MRAQHGNIAWNAPPSPFWLRLLKRNLPIVLFLLLATVGMGAVYWFFSPPGADADAAATVSVEGGLHAPIHKAIPQRAVVQRMAQSPGPRRVGIIVGHRGSDSGAVCTDGLTEVEINANIANQVATELGNRGVRTELLDEFDPRLDGYSATAVVSIHADSCDYINELATGFKISGSPLTDSSGLSICIERAYGEATSLPYNVNTITPHMTDYHAFRKISLATPAIIIEVGFIHIDRELLTTDMERPVSGLVNGILCFLDAR